MIKIGSKTISEKSPVFIVAEAGVNHNGNLKLAKKLIDVAVLAGVDAVKFQTFNPDTLVAKNVSKADYQAKNEKRLKKEESQYEMLKRLMLPREWHKELKKYAESKGLIFLSTPFSLDDAVFLRKLGVKAIKVGSTDTENLPYLAKIAKWNLPIILSTGMSALPEIKEAVRTIQKAGNDKLIVLHCTTNYPTPFEEVNLRAIATLQRELKNIPIGFSEHTVGIEATVASVALGARVIEKHFTLDKNFPGPDHSASLEPDELKQLVSSVRRIETAMGTGNKVLFVSEKKIAEVARKSLVVARDIPSGKQLTAEDVSVKRPGTGIKPKFLNKIIGKTAKVNLQKDQLLSWDLIK
ncbi:MAG: N-acetylneuraminate synthase [Candidatus Yanofskybacteria bacterium RIFCSPLOWO2_02_FULL_43_10]|uniref:N-acetylneuraminate synthase n=1 Tax=Candidatus Yanofskybacteria bacterium RIFCSPLOWO2_12_FULL_43_11b TaxID=1802710 RepID=A0A1F8H7H0_9BACT|nr:MAG: N-acetylneuraminate synthase [Candidatus Yanofskybacteria bacterium RIFCSPHIGHO2_01_FULL_43_32]OGN11003.1 MAG: N-acetylneuraminate synthase [Candidatus Yanofskybacteria bacterium RIFCSPHIGHO2_02_FULL_43_12]OGN18154.1 MAG: N-acetylneuraminate synthase [Candidatus Yanofskybacteria bacterium RIFCSPHIGHO2_12_FULL_43_11]OGN24130.1 MAG: N-acetylneuraminate synthase [Candidatus Yanofskybacteria bacterium RIFCSPLOWO2_01_FULL_43_46]OGN30553.1 MAG: N-acetylneuraminate synthase [Candidatus Yanofsk